MQTAERKVQGGSGGGAEGLTDSEHSDSDSSDEEEDEEEDDAERGRVADTSDDEEQTQRCRVVARRSTHEYQNVSQLEWDNSTM